VVVADAHSSDRTREIAREAGCTVVDGGLPGAGRNAGARASRGALLLFLDADVRIGPGFVGDAAGELLRRRLDMATCPYDPDRADHGCGLLVSGYNAILQRSPFMRPVCWGPCILISRSLFERIGGFDGALRVAEDGDLVRRASRQGRFRILRTVRPVMSTRRIRREGALRILIRIAVSEAYMVFRPRIYGISIFSNEFWDRRIRADR
jgi:glycosyltransferase involved in cell wall biosynthesis